jgi:hypothetical protein
MKKALKISFIVFIVACFLPCSAILIYSAITPSSTQTPTPTPTHTPAPAPSFAGNLLLSFKGERTIYKLAFDANTGTTVRTPIFEEGDSAMLSTDGKYLFVYQQENRRVTMINLASDEKTSFEIQEDLNSFGYSYYWMERGLLGGGISISPDNRSICHTTDTGEIYLYSIPQNKSQVIYQAPSARYSPSDSSEVYLYYGEAVCGPWLGNDRFVIYRHTGPMPSEMPAGSGIGLEPDTTTIVTVGDEPKFEDINQWLYVEAISPNSRSLVYTDTESRSVYLVRGFNNFNEMTPRLIAQDRDWDQQSYFEFLSEDRLFSYHPDAAIDLESLESREWELPDKCVGDWQWIGNPEDNLIACGCDELCYEETQVSSSDRSLTPDSYQYSSAILIYDLTKGSLIRIHDLEFFHTPDEISFIGWYP